MNRLEELQDEVIDRLDLPRPITAPENSELEQTEADIRNVKSETVLKLILTYTEENK